MLFNLRPPVGPFSPVKKKIRIAKKILVFTTISADNILYLVIREGNTSHTTMDFGLRKCFILAATSCGLSGII